MLGALGCLKNKYFEKNSKCARYVYYLSESTTRTSNFQKKTVPPCSHKPSK